MIHIVDKNDDCPLKRVDKKTKYFRLQPSLAALGDGLPSTAGSQRDEAKMQASVMTKNRTQDLNQDDQRSKLESQLTSR